MSNLKTKRIQLGDHATPSNNFVIRQPDTPDGKMHVGNGLLDSSNDIVTITNTDGGRVGIGHDNPQKKLEVWTGNQELSHFGSNNANASGNYTGITLGYAESGNQSYRKVGIVSAGTGDGAARQNLHFLLDTIADGGSVDLNDTKMKIDYNGIVTMPSQPGFRAYVNANYTHPSGNVNISNTIAGLGYWSKSFDNQNNFNNSTGLFTAPVDGMYSFSAGLNGNSNTSNITYFSCEFLINGGRTSITWFGNIKSGTSSYVASNNATTFNLSAGDTVGLHSEISASQVLLGSSNGSYSFFSGHLVG